MKITTEINNRARSPVSPFFFSKAVSRTIEESGIGFLKKKDIEVSVALVGSREIKKLNRIYRKKDEVTDVLSFGEDIKSDGEKDKKIFLGEIVLCYDYITRHFKNNSKDELVRAVSHGVLHLLGLKHGKRMFELENNIVTAFRNKYKK